MLWNKKTKLWDKSLKYGKKSKWGHEKFEIIRKKRQKPDCIVFISNFIIFNIFYDLLCSHLDFFIPSHNYDKICYWDTEFHVNMRNIVNISSLVRNESIQTCLFVESAAVCKR